MKFWKKSIDQDKQKGEIPKKIPNLKLLLTVAAAAIGLALLAIILIFQYMPKQDTSVETVQTKPTIATSVTKDDPDWLENYCKEQAAALPEAPFEYNDVEESNPTSIPPNYISTRLPEDKKFKSQTCRLSYSFDNNEAYASMGVEYKMDIRNSNEFGKNVSIAHEDEMDSTWTKISPLDRKESGNPAYSGDDLPLVLTRENKDLGTVEYATMEFGIDYFVRITVYEK
jgi:hypothetical protein